MRLLAMLSLLFCATASLPAQSDVRESTSLKFVPADVGFYSSSLQLRRQIETVLNSRAVAKIKQLPAVQAAMEQVKQQWENTEDAQIKTFKALLAMPENQQLVEMLVDAGSHEVFVYGEDQFAELIVMLNRINALSRQAQVEALASQNKSEEEFSRKFIAELTAHADKLRLPDLMIGFRVADAERATTQIARLEAILGLVLGQRPEWKDRLRRERLGEVEYLTFEFRGVDLPWEEFAANVPEAQRENFQKFAEIIKRQTIYISLGVYQGYLLISLGDNNEHLTKLGQGPLLANRAEMAPLGKFGAKSYSSIGFVDGELLSKMNSTQQQIDNMVDIAEQLLPSTTLSEDMRKELIDDMKSLREQLVKFIPRPASLSSFTWLSDRGFEGYMYQWSGGKALDDKQHLSILEHTGGALAFVAARSRPKPEQYEFAAKFLERVVYHSERIGLAQLQAADREMYEKVRQELEPLVIRWRAIFRDKIIPSLADGQSALVLDARTASTQWHQQLPPASQPLPMLELAIVIGLSDSRLLGQGVVESKEVIQEAINRLHKLFPDKVPDFKIPKAGVRQVTGGDVYYYALPADAGFDKQVAPNAGLGTDVAVVSLIPKQTVRLLDKVTPPSYGPLARTSGPLGAAAYMNFSGIIDAVRPWVSYGMELAEKQNANPEQLAMAKEPIQVALDVMACLREMSSVTYSEGDAAVSHFEWHFQDLP